ncbi:transcription termination factor 4, mitochondrial isoform X1 [Uranotaenia lowii]|uniref:transcription termination factor 4, mitochondrial isoform X1 n=2 Tax=Uranotaenia lowii TaxID=190385 RepID=UPI002478E424|nr:transcription termination factor 4, mitochondrial isoform X1 [Uranotaenia lowii]
MIKISTKTWSVIRCFCTGKRSNLVESLTATIGLDPKMLADALDASPQLNRYTSEQWVNTHHILDQEGIGPSNFLSIVVQHPDLLARSSDRLMANLNGWRSCQFGDQQLQTLFTAHPQLLDLADSNQLTKRVSFLHSYFETRKNVWRLFLNSPGLVTDRQDQIKSKIEYLIDEMRVEIPEIVKSSALNVDLEVIRCRHVFLERLGLYKARSLKADPDTPSTNPKLHQITDTSDKRFAVKVAYVTLEEYEVFVELFRREQDRRSGAAADKDDSDASDDDEDEEKQSKYRKYSKKRR